MVGGICVRGAFCAGAVILGAALCACAMGQEAPAAVESPAALVVEGTAPAEIDSTAAALVIESTAPAAESTEAYMTPPTPTSGTMALTVPQAIIMSLENNRAFVIQRYNPEISMNLIEVERAAFDPDLTGQLSYRQTRNRVLGLGLPIVSRTQNETGSIGISEFFPTGTTVSLNGATTLQSVPDVTNKWASQASLSVTQSLLRGFGLDVNLAGLRQSRLAYLASEYQLRGAAESLIASTESTYWDYSLAIRNIEIFNESLAIAQQQLSETRERIRVGQISESEVYAAEAEVALRRQNLIQARATLDETRVALLVLLSPKTSDPLALDVALAEEPALPSESIDGLEDHIAVAERMRPDLNQARLQVNSGDLSIVRTKNGLLPRLDFFADLSRTGFGRTFGSSVDRIDDGSYDFFTGISGEYPIGNRAARAVYENSVFSRDQSLEAVANLAQSVEADVRTAYIEVVRARDQVGASAATSRLQEETLRAETAKFRVGKSTTLLVGQAQRDLLQAQIAEVSSVVSYRKALVQLYLNEGSLLERRGIACPGTKAVTMTTPISAAKLPPPGCEPQTITLPPQP